MSELLTQVRNYWNRRPCNVRHSLQEVGSREYFDEVEKRRYFVEPHIPDFAKFERWRGKRVLEVGCGIGTDAANFSRAGADLTVIDFSEKSLELCRQRFQVFGLKANFVLANVEELPKYLEAQTFDLIYSFGVLHHTPNPAAAFRQLRQYMHADSELRVMVYSRWSWKSLDILLRNGRKFGWSLDKAVPMYSEAQTGSPVTFIYNFRGVRALLQDYDIAKIWKDHIFMYQVDHYVQHVYKLHWYFRWMPEWFRKFLRKTMGWHTLVVAKPRVASINS